MKKQDWALINPQSLICHKTQLISFEPFKYVQMKVFVLDINS